jgi:hypothetical protein
MALPLDRDFGGEQGVLDLVRGNKELMVEVADIARLAPLEHPHTVAGVRRLARVFAWSNAEASALAWFLHELGAATEHEASWLAAFTGVDAPRR